MKLIAALSLAFLAPYTVHADSIETCAKQNPCVKFTIQKHSRKNCGGRADCEYRICMEQTYGGTCGKAPEERMAYTCKKPYGVCLAEKSGFLGVDTSTLTKNLKNGYKQCQTVKMGALAKFLINDGSPEGDCGTSTKEVGPTVAQCSTYGKKSCTNNFKLVGTECMWTVRAPNDCTSVAASYGDPHFKVWNNYKPVHFHGECDLVLLSSDHVNGDDRLDLHVRTTVEKHYSFIESAALQVGQSLVQIDRTAIYVNKIEHRDEDLPLKLLDFEILMPEHDPNKKTKMYTIVLNDKSRITVKKVNRFLAVAAFGHEDDFAHSKGILGDYYTGGTIGRQRQEIFDANELGLEWQVRASDPNLFMDLREPQLPAAQCRMPTEERVSRHMRALQDSGLYENAKIACGDKADVESCLDDVMATGDLTIAAHQDW